MRYSHPLNKLQAPEITKKDGICAELIKTFQAEYRPNIYNIYLRGQNALPIRQHDVDTAAIKMKGLIMQPLITCESRIRSLEREVQNLIHQLAEPVEYEESENTFLDKMFSTLEKIKKLRGKNDG